jgi:hypothetical protein
LVGSSSSKTLALLTTRVARDSRVFSPPESTAAGLSTSSPEKRKLPRILRTSVSPRSGAAVFMFSRTVRSTSRFSCSWA